MHLDYSDTCCSTELWKIDITSVLVSNFCCSSLLFLPQRLLENRTSSSKETMYYSTLLVPALMSCCCLVAAVRAAQAPAPPAPPAPPVGCASYTILDYGISETASALGNLKVNSTSACCAACKCHYICVRVVMYRTRIHTSACAHTS